MRVAAVAAAARAHEAATRVIVEVVMVAMAVTLTGCLSGSDVVAADVRPERWSGAVSVTRHNDDTLSVRRLTLALRHSPEATPTTGNYIVGVIAPGGAVTALTVPLEIDPAAGGAGRMGESKAMIHNGLHFNEPGDWRFTVTPVETTRGVWSVAIESSPVGPQR